MTNTSNLNSEYSEFGQPYKNYATSSEDTINFCLPGAFMNNSQLAVLDSCTDYVPQRCALNWDSKCDTYFESLSDPVEVNKFIRNALQKKLCRLSDTSTCTQSCQPFDFMSQTSPSVCTYLGNDVVKDSNQKIDIGYYTSVNLSPDYLNKCLLTCDKISPADIKDGDFIVESALTLGNCNDILQNVCDVANGKTFGNTMLNEFCSLNKPSTTSTTSSSPIKTASTRFTVGKRRMKRSHWIMLFLIIVLLGLLIYKKYLKN